ncbi:MAG: HlyD family secretion protein, partial [Planctomycetia bacterium]
MIGKIARTIRTWFLPVLAAASFAFATVNVLRAQQAPPPAKPPVQPAESPFGSTVAGSGMAEARTENIHIGAHVAGVVKEVFVKVGRRVRTGEPLFSIDDRPYKAELGVKEAMLAAAEARLQRLESMPRPEQIPPGEARVKAAEANLGEQEDLLRRAEKLATSRSIGQEELVGRRMARENARQKFVEASADLRLLLAGAWEPDKLVARSEVIQARSEVDRLKIDLERLVVKSPMDGDVLHVNVRPGEFCAAPSSADLVVLGDVERLHVRVDVDEHDIPRFRTGTPAAARVRGDVRREYALTFVRVEPFVIPKKSLTGDNNERVDTRVLQVLYELKPA